jgi:hypothetical protein
MKILYLIFLLWSSPFDGARWAERNANERSGANSYSGSERDNPYPSYIINYYAFKFASGEYLNINEFILFIYSSNWENEQLVGFKTK